MDRNACAADSRKTARTFFLSTLHSHHCQVCKVCQAQTQKSHVTSVIQSSHDAPAVVPTDRLTPTLSNLWASWRKALNSVLNSGMYRASIPPINSSTVVHQGELIGRNNNPRTKTISQVVQTFTRCTQEKPQRGSNSTHSQDGL